MNNELLIAIEILLLIVLPLLVLYLRGRWPLGIVIACLLILPGLWYLTYAPLHELSHMVGTYLVGGRVSNYKLIPQFWKGEFGVAWITPLELLYPWQYLVMFCAPYVFDLLGMVIGIALLHRRLSKNAFVVGIIFMLLCLRPAFDLVCETVSFLNGFQGDLYHIQEIVGSMMLWSFLAVALGIAFLSIGTILQRYVSFPEQ